MYKDLDDLQSLNEAKGFKAVHLNIRSLIGKIDLLRSSIIDVD